MDHPATRTHSQSLRFHLQHPQHPPSTSIFNLKLLNSAGHVLGYGMAPLDRVGAQAQLLINVVMYGVGFAAALKVLPELDEEY